MQTITIDFETYWSRNYTLSKMPMQQYILDPAFQVMGIGVKIDDDKTFWVPGYVGHIDLVLRALDLPNNAVCCQHTLFDGAVLEWRYGIKPKFYFDTRMMAGVFVKPWTGSAGLAAIAEHFSLPRKTGEILLKYKGMRLEDMTPEGLAELGDYCKHDVDLTRVAFNRMAGKFGVNDLKIQNLTTRMFTERTLELDGDMLQDVVRSLNFQRDSLVAAAGCEASDLSSNMKFKQLLERLAVACPMKISPTTGAPAPALAKSDVEFQALQKHPNAAVRKLVEARLAVKGPGELRRAQRLLGLQGAVGVPLIYAAAHTLRYGGTDALNWQNFKAKRNGGRIRDAVCAPKGHTLVVGDSSQIEGRLNAETSGQEDMLTQFAAGDDVYARFAEKIYNRPINKNDDPEERFVGKTGILGLGYGAGKPKFYWMCESNKIAITEMQASYVHTIYRRSYQNIVNQWALAETMIAYIAMGKAVKFMHCEVREGINDHLWLPNGLPLIYKGLRIGPDGWEYDNHTPNGAKLYGAKLVENIMQALANVIVLEQMLKLSEMGWKVVLQVHDEIVLCVPIERAEEAKAAVLMVMSAQVSWAPTLPLACDVEVAERYGHAK